MSQPHNHCVIELRGSPKVCWVDYLQDVLVYEQIEDGTVRSTALDALGDSVLVFTMNLRQGS